MRLCEIEGCASRHYGRGWCRAHYLRWQRYGDPETMLRAPNGHAKVVPKRRYYTLKPQVERRCLECGENFMTARVDQQFCDDRCGRRFRSRKTQQPWNGRRRANYQKRRAQKKAAPVGDPVVLEEIRERDGNRCGICGGQINGKPYPHPLSASLDHMVPLSAGGAHDPANVQLAHLRCNLRKGARGGGEQLRLHG